MNKKLISRISNGFGNQMYMDDANIPSLLSLPYLGAIDAKSPLYQNTRKFILSEKNPWFFVASLNISLNLSRVVLYPSS